MIAIRWLLKEHRPEKVGCSLVIYLNSTKQIEGLRMGKKFCRITKYDLNRGSKDKGRGPIRTDSPA